MKRTTGPSDSYPKFRGRMCLTWKNRQGDICYTKVSDSAEEVADYLMSPSPPDVSVLRTNPQK